MLNRRWMMRQIVSAEAEDIPPEGGRFVKSLNSDGSSWIVTDFYPDSETVFTFRFNKTSWYKGYENFFGAAGYQFRLQRNASSGTSILVDLYGLRIANIVWTPSGDHVFVFDCPTASFTIDNGSYKKTGTPVSEYVKLEYPLLLFAMGKNTKKPTEPDSPGKFKLYEASVKQNGVLTHKWRPAIDGNGVACLYDTVTQKCLYNAGTGTFTFDE